MDLREVRVYVISPGTGKFRKRLQETITRLRSAGFTKIEHVWSVPDPNPTDSLSRTNLVIWEKEQDRAGPFLVVEDDIQVVPGAGFVLTLPPGAAAIYLGVSVWVYPYEYHTLSCGKNIRHITGHDTRPYDDHLVEVRGMTGGHAILYLDRGFTRTLSLCVRSHLGLHTAHDLVLATLQRHFPVYAMKNPLFYQDAMIGGQQNETKLRWQDNRFAP